MKSKLIIIGIDDILRIFRDYLGPEAVPADASAVRLLVNPAEKGAFAIDVASASFGTDEPPVSIHFDLKRYYGV